MVWSEMEVRTCRPGLFGPRLGDRLRLWRRYVLRRPTVLTWGGVIHPRIGPSPTGGIRVRAQNEADAAEWIAANRGLEPRGAA